MPIETTHLPVEGAAAQLGAAAFLATIAYPDRIAKRRQFIEDVKAWLLKTAIDRGYPRSAVRQQYRQTNWRDIDRHFDGVLRNIKKKQPAIDIARMGLFHWAVPVSLGNHPYTQNRMITNMAGGPDLRGNFYRDVWRPAKRVVHLLLALETSDDLTPGRPCYIEDLITDPQWLLGALTEAESGRMYFVMCPHLRIEDGDTIQLLPER